MKVRTPLSRIRLARARHLVVALFLAVVLAALTVYVLLGFFRNL